MEAAPRFEAGKLLDLERLGRAKAELDPFPYLIVPSFIRSEVLQELIRDFPRLEGPRNHAVGVVEHGPTFDALLTEIAAPAFSRLLGEKLGYPGLEHLPHNVSVRAFCEPSDGHIHTDHWSKVVTVLLYPNLGWDDRAGRLRILRSAHDLEDYAAEAPPLDGTLLAFRRGRRSYHGHHSYAGPRRVVQVSWLRRSSLARAWQGAARAVTHARKRLGLHASA